MHHLCLLTTLLVFAALRVCGLSQEEIKDKYELFKTATFAPQYTNDETTFELILLERRQNDGSSSAAYEKAAALYNEALGLYRDQHMQHAIANFVAAVQTFTSLTDGWNNLSIIAQALGLMDAATKYAALSLIFSPPDKVSAIRSYASCHVNLFIKNGQERDREIALVYLRKAIHLSKKFEKEIVEAYTALLINAGEPTRCIDQLESLASKFKAASQEVQAMRVASLAICYRDSHDGDAAVAHFEKAIELNPSESSYHYELGGMFKRTEFPTLLDIGRSLQHVQQALELAPNSAVITYSLAGVYSIARQLEQAVELYERAFRLDPKLDIALVEAYHLKQTLCNWKNRTPLMKRMISMAEKQLKEGITAIVGLNAVAPHLTPWHALAMPTPPGFQRQLARSHMRVEAMKGLNMHYKEIDDLNPDEPTDDDTEEVTVSNKINVKTRPYDDIDDDYDDPYDDEGDDDDRGARSWIRRTTQGTSPQPTWTPASLDAALGSDAWRRAKVRLGVVSADISDSNVGQSLIGWLRDPDTDNGRIEVIIYSLVDNDGSGWRALMCGGDDSRCKNIGSLPVDEIVTILKQDKIDILLNLNGFTKFSRNALFARRVVPVNVNYKGYPSTMGAYHDYIIGDRTLTPLTHHQQYSELIVQLPHSFFLTSYPEGFGHNLDETRAAQYSKASLKLQIESERHPTFVFCCFNHLYKVTPEIFDIWMRLLKEIPNSVMWFMHLPNGADKHLKREAAKRNVQKSRLRFSELFALSEHLSAKQQCDLFLDTPLFNAHGTATDTLWAGVPLLTKLGDTMQSRAAASHLHALGVPELVVDSFQQYENLALELAKEHSEKSAEIAGCDEESCKIPEPSKLSVFRERIRANRLTSNLFCARRWWHDARLAFTMMRAVSRNQLQKRHLVLPRNLNYSHIPAIADYLVTTKPTFFDD